MRTPFACYESDATPEQYRSEVIVLLCAGVWCSAGDGAHSRPSSAREHSRHNKRGAFSGIPPYKLGHDIPVVTHSVLKPLVVSYPPTAVPVNVKVPLGKYPVGVGQRVPVPHPHYGLKFPHLTKNVFLGKPDHHFHHHHHHVTAKPAIAILPASPAPVVPVPVPQPTVPVAQPLPAPAPPPVFLETAPVSPPSHVLPATNHVHIKPVIPAIAPPPVIQTSAPYIPFAPQYPYVIRPGGAIHASVFANYPKYPLASYSPPFVPIATPNIPLNQVFLEPAQNPHYHLVPQAVGHTLVEPSPAIGVHHIQQSVGVPQVNQAVDVHQVQSPIGVHQVHQGIDVHQVQHVVGVPHGHQTVDVHQVQPAVDFPHVHQAGDVNQAQGEHAHHTPVEQGGWAPIPATAPVHEPSQPQAHETHHFQQDQGGQVYEHHSDEQLFHEYRRQLQAQLERAQYEQQLHNQQLHNQGHLGQEYGTPQLGQEFGPQQLPQEYNGPQQIHQEYGPPNQHLVSEYGLPQQAGDDFGVQQHQIGSEYGVPQQQQGREYAEGRARASDDDEQPQRYHNHIPLGLQPPIDRPLEHFR
ncbi:hypothetical protein EVAR_97314_1 [Eumeta japonica]|uniref:Uncharacterized protein n=1 Tax=Eumeta variegata TaxID=151549 RepID=A0A4C1X701_EUMVA|nr:hypothetical protein EVAR_97314_1 [Eumeta japonica]